MEIMEFMQKYQEDTKRRQELVSNTDYIEWLYNFTDTHPKFSDDSWDYDGHNTLSEDDYEKVKRLTDFFTAIKEYCSENLIASLGIARDFSYVIKYKDKYFEMGVCIGQGAFNYVAASKEVTTSYILFESIMNNTEDHNLAIKKEKLEKIKEIIGELKALGTPEEEIRIIMRIIYQN